MAAHRAEEEVEEVEEEVVEEEVEAVGGPLRSAVTARLPSLTETEVARPAVTATDLSAPGLSAQPRPRRGRTPRLM